jgi:4-hydroxybenzoate polyprenyltransferase
MVVTRRALLVDAVAAGIFIGMAAVLSPWYLFGVLYVLAIIVADSRLKAARRKRRSQVLHGGCGSHSVQAGRDVNLP